MLRERILFFMALFSIDTDYCLNFNYKSTDCRLCRDICPQKCWREDGGMEAGRCDSCGLCVAICPSDAIAVEGYTQQAWQEMTAEASIRPLALGCRKYNCGNWACLGFLTAPDLIALSWQSRDLLPQKLLIYHSRCAECRPAVAEHLQREIIKANDFLDRLGGGTISTAHGEMAGSGRVNTVDRRAFFQSLFTAGASAARNVLWPEDAFVRLPRNEWRANCLRGRNHPALQGKQSLFATLVAEKNCVACGLCAKICPTAAIREKETPDALTLFFEPLACSQCGLCIQHCPENCLRIVEEGPAEEYILICKDYPRCIECGQTFKPAGKQESCIECLLKGRRQIFGPEETEF